MLDMRDDERRALYKTLSTVSVDGAPAEELRGYLEQDFNRFLLTQSLVPRGEGMALEVGANPYFMSVLMGIKHPHYCFEYLNYFEGFPDTIRQAVTWSSGAQEFVSSNVNIEATPIPAEDERYDLILFCEVLEHLTHHPLGAINELHRVLRPGGTLILTTPNVARFDNVVALLEGRNLYDPYSAYGPHGRHNREYSRHELHQLMQHAGFTPDGDFTADVHPRLPTRVPEADVNRLLGMIPHRNNDLGQYLFSRWKRTHYSRKDRPQWLYRSYPVTGPE